VNVLHALIVLLGNKKGVRCTEASHVWWYHRTLRGYCL